MKLTQAIFLLFSLMIVLTLTSTIVHAHLEGGSDEIVNGYIIDFGYSPLHPSALESTILNFNLVNTSTNQTVPVSSIWLRISDDDEIIFTGSFKPNDGNVNFIYTFPRGKDYELYVKFYNDTGILVEHKYILDVNKERLNASGYILLGLIVVLILIFLIIYNTVSRNRRKKIEI